MIPSAVALSLDSLAAGIAIGPLVRSRKTGVRLALLFAVCDALAGWAGWQLGVALPEWLSPLAPAGFAVYGIYLLAVGGAVSSRPWLVWLLPALLSFDNMLCPMPPQQALLCGALSGAFAWAGLRIGAIFGACVGRGRERSSGVAALGAAALMLAF
jgi:putative Mn2+ efflux pump MntP